ncbi:LacI family transcriptional regulator [Christensenellaceae bacterium OttesenSCG-928-K19]|nr:LacI family transcriptional regulator [Christensenellaceae bacterium OttesenSCG-928-K19]
MKKQAVTMKDVAKKAGVTQPTVSHVINGTASISTAVKERVFAAIKELNYRPNALAKGLKTNSTKTIGLIMPDITNSYYACIAKEMEQLLIEKGYMTFFSSTNYSRDSEMRLVDKMMRYNVDGIFVMFEFLNEEPLKTLQQYGIPAVVLDDDAEQFIKSKINMDNELGGYLATKHLIERGRKRIAFAAEKAGILAMKDRFEGYKRALKEAGLPVDDAIVLRDETLQYRFDAGHDYGKQLVAKKIDGIFASTDMVALGVLRSFADQGIKVPDDIAVVGYDDIPLAELATPALTTMSQPAEKVAKAAMEQLLVQIAGEGEGEKVVVNPQLVVRETT